MATTKGFSIAPLYYSSAHFENLLRKDYGLGPSTLLCEQYRRGVRFLLFGDLDIPAHIPQKRVRYRTCDADDMSMTEFQTILDAFEELSFQGLTLGDFLPLELQPEKKKVENTSVYNQFLDRLNHSNTEEILLEAMDYMEDLIKLFHAMDGKTRYTWIKFLITVAPKLEKNFIYYLISEFKIPYSTSPKIISNSKKYNSKALARIIEDYNLQFADSPLEQVEFQMFSMFRSLNDTISAVGTASETISDSVKKVDQRCDAIQNSVTTAVTDSVKFAKLQTSTLVDRMIELVDKIEPVAAAIGQQRSFIEEVKIKIKEHSVAIGLNVVILLTEKSYAKWSVALMSITSMLGINKMFLDKLMEYCGPSLGFQASNTIKLLALCSTFMGKYNPVHLIGMSSAFNTMKEIKAIEELSVLVNEVAVEWGLWDSPEAQLAKMVKENVAGLLDDLVELELIELNTPSKYLLDSNYKRVKDNFDKVVELEVQFVKSKMPGIEGTTLIPELAKLHSAYRNLHIKVSNIRKGEARRQEPLAVVFLGAPGIGKSKFATDLISGKNSLLCKRFRERKLDEKKQWEEMNVTEWNVWNENVSDKMDYSDGYCGQDIHATDDLFQSASDNDHQRYINYISPQRFITNQASLESKGMPYTSKLFVGSCNQFPTSSKTIKEVAALQRRFVVVECKLTGIVPLDRYDHDFKHLSFDVYNTGVDYVQKMNKQVMNKNQLVDMVLDGLQRKYKIYCEEMEFDYVFEQAAVNVKKMHYGEAAAMIASTTRMSFSDWHVAGNDPDKAFTSIIYSKADGSTIRLLEMARVDPRYYDPSVVFLDYELWIPNSSVAVKRFCMTPCHFMFRRGTDMFVIGFQKDENNVPTLYYFTQFIKSGDCDENQHFYTQFEEPDSFTTQGLQFMREQLWSMYASTSNIFKGIWNRVKQGYAAFKNWIASPLSAVEVFVSNFLWSCFGLDLDSVLSQLGGVVIDQISNCIIGFSLLLIYQKLTSFVTLEKTCELCVKFGNSKVEKILTSLKEKICKCNCNLGYIYSTHTETCQTFESLYSDMIKLCCICDGKCTEDCGHTVEDPERTYNQFRKIIFSEFGCVPKELDLHFSEVLGCRVFHEVRNFELICRKCTKDDICADHAELDDLVQNIVEGSDTSIKMKRKIKSILEGSDTSIKQKKKAHVLLEASDNSQTKKKKVKVSLEGKVVDAKLVDLDGVVINEDRFINKVRLLDNSESTEEYSFELQVDPAVFSLVDPLMTNIVRCYRYNPVTQTIAQLNGIGYKNFVITPSHLYKDPSHQHWYERSCETSKIPLIHVHTERDRDLTIWKHNGQEFSQLIEKHLCSNDDIVNYLPSADNCIMAIPAYSEKNRYVHLLHCKGTHLATHKVSVMGQGMREFKDLIKVVGLNMPNIPTEPGDCGAPILLSCKKSVRKIIGLHILGGKTSAYSTVFSRETLAKLLESAEVVQQEAETRFDNFEPKFDQIECSSKLPILDVMGLCNTISQHPLYPAKGDMEYLGQYDYNAVPAKETSLLTHPLYGAFPITQIPAVLQNYGVEDVSQLEKNAADVPDILLTQLYKYSKPVTFVEGLDRDLEDMTSQLTSHFSMVLAKCDLGVMSLDEALSGMETWDASLPLDMRTTAGEPFARSGVTPGKKKGAFVKITTNDQNRKMYSLDTSTTHGKYLSDVIDIKDKLAQKGYRTLSIWKNCLKDETRPIEKVRVGKTRLFTAAPFDTVLLGRKYFGRFKENWQKHNFELCHSVGISAVSPEWSELAMHLLARGDCFSDADFSSYDGNLRSDFMRAAGKIVCDTIANVEGIDTVAHQTIWEEFVETVHVSGRVLHLVKHGNPSGNPMTTVVNCIVNLLYHWWCFRKIVGKDSFSKFNQEVGFTCFGDDVVFCTTKTSEYTFDKVAGYMKILGQDYTTADKSSTSSSVKTIQDIQFLKRKFVKLTSLKFLAPLDTDSIEQQFNYTNIGPNDFLTIGVQLDEASIEASLHGSEYYAHFKKNLESALWRNDLLRQHRTSLDMYTDVRADAIKRQLEQAT